MTVERRCGVRGVNASKLTKKATPMKNDYSVKVTPKDISKMRALFAALDKPAKDKPAKDKPTTPGADAIVAILADIEERVSALADAPLQKLVAKLAQLLNADAEPAKPEPKAPDAGDDAKAEVDRKMGIRSAKPSIRREGREHVLGVLHGRQGKAEAARILARGSR